MQTKSDIDYRSGQHKKVPLNKFPMLIDLQKTVDTINHEFLLDKSHAICFSEKTVAWFKSYLSDREFKVNINNHFSNLSKISSGVPQGSILGPLLFLLYVSDMPQAINSDLFLYANDSGLTFQHKNLHTVEHQFIRTSPIYVNGL